MFDLRLVPEEPVFKALAGTSFDFAFVDSGDRAANLIGTHSLVRDDGIVVLHDAHRDGYLPGVQRYPHGHFIENHSLVLFKTRERFEAAVARSPPDARCACKYCGAEERIAYRTKLSEALRTTTGH